MTLDELAASLPHGFHDAELCAVTIKFTEREARLTLDIWLGDDESREAYRQAEVTLTGLVFWICEPPDAHQSCREPGPLTIDIGPLTDLPHAKRSGVPQIPPRAFSNWTFVLDWNAFIYVAAENANLKWLGNWTVR